MLRNITKYIVAGATATMMFLSPATAQDKIVMRVAHAMPESHSYQKWVEKFRDELEKLVPGRVDVQIFPNAQLGKETEYIEGMSFGTIDGAVMGRHGQIDPRLDVLNLPMIFRDDAHKDVVMRSGGEIQKQLDDIMYEKGFKVLGWGELGFRYITTKDKPIKSAADLKGVDIRVPNVEPWLVAFRAWGANPTPMDFSELYSALQQGVVSAQENPPEIIETSRFYEVQKYLSLTRHASIPSQFVVSRAFWEKLPEDLQAPVMKAATISRDYQVALTREANSSLVSKLQEQGMVVIEDVDRESFRAGAEEAYAKYQDIIGADLIKAVQEAH
ncbi:MULTISPECIES: TRAP transporter substrate-binding protein [Chelativorans]|uniref:TRAP dicarboxylate transporter, DctP subunit n=1 Tax=Chelativorans sp. (strain BNC1) TaxID=266779 RepID=Q11K86_CHESB|nr:MULTISPECIES: TRAP transporter substrate-binding protein [Chelativorans]